MNDNSGPTWCVNSNEVGAGAGALLLVGGLILILLPAFFVGYIIASLIWDVKIFKYPMALAFAVGNFYLLAFLYKIAPMGAAMFVILSWLLLDFAGAKGKVSDMWIVKTIRKTFGWLFSA